MPLVERPSSFVFPRRLGAAVPTVERAEGAVLRLLVHEAAEEPAAHAGDLGRALPEPLVARHAERFSGVHYAELVAFRVDDAATDLRSFIGNRLSVDDQRRGKTCHEFIAGLVFSGTDGINHDHGQIGACRNRDFRRRGRSSSFNGRSRCSGWRI